MIRAALDLTGVRRELVTAFERASVPLRHRIARAEQVLGRSLEQPAAIAAVHIALVADAQSRHAASDAARLPADAGRP